MQRISNKRIGVYLFHGMAVFAVLGCDALVSRNRDFDIWSSSVATDSCQVAQRVEQYWIEDEMNNARRRISSTLRSDRDSLLRLKHRDADWDILEYLIEDEEFNAQPGCETSLSIEPSSGGSRAGVQILYEFRMESASQLCHLTPFEYRLGRSGEDVFVSGVVRSCIDTTWQWKTFEVDYAE